ncbi:hypothetical protein SAMN05880592_11070 [Bosea sp. TND4EK4]|nr:hypothetical protein SAMN05880592_11070 [Bosea sp. TND4EK4]
MVMPTPTIPGPNFSFPGVLNSKQLLVAEAVQARAWASLEEEVRLGLETEADAKARLGRIVVRLIADNDASVSDLTTAVVDDFRKTGPSISARR